MSHRPPGGHRNFPIVLRILADGHRTSPRFPPTEPRHLFRGGQHRREGARHPPRSWVPPPSTSMYKNTFLVQTKFIYFRCAFGTFFWALLIKLFFFCAALRQLGPIFVGDSRGPAGTGGGVGPAPPPRHENDLLGGDSLPNLRERQLLGPSHVTPPARRAPGHPGRAPELPGSAPHPVGSAPRIPSLSSHGAAPPASWPAPPPGGCEAASAWWGCVHIGTNDRNNTEPNGAWVAPSSSGTRGDRRGRGAAWDLRRPLVTKTTSLGGTACPTSANGNF